MVGFFFYEFRLEDVTYLVHRSVQRQLRCRRRHRTNLRRRRSDSARRSVSRSLRASRCTTLLRLEDIPRRTLKSSAFAGQNLVMGSVELWRARQYVFVRTLLKVGRYLRSICVEWNEPRRIVGLIPRPQETCLLLLQRRRVDGLGLCRAWRRCPWDGRGKGTIT